MLNNRQPGRRRGRTNQRPQGNGGRGQEQGNRVDNRARGNAPQMLEKYKALARDAQMQGDRVITEYYLQFADHYFRVVAETRARFEETRRQRDDWSGDDNDGDLGDNDDAMSGDALDGDDDDAASERAYDAQRRQPRQQQPQQQRDARPFDGNRNDNGRSHNEERPRDDRPREERPRQDRGNGDQAPPRGDRVRRERPSENADQNPFNSPSPRRDGEPRERAHRNAAPASAHDQSSTANDFIERAPHRERTPRQPVMSRGENAPATIDASVLPSALGTSRTLAPVAFATTEDAPTDTAPKRRGRPRKLADDVAAE